MHDHRITPLAQKSEHPSAYFVQDRSNQEELTRLRAQDAMVTASMGGVLPEQSNPLSFQRVLDVGCGTGGWLIELAKTAPTSAILVGVDVSLTFVQYARVQAEAAKVGDRVEFYVMDALRMLEFSTGFFDLVNHRFGMSWLRSWEWSKLLHEYQRVARRGGIIRCVEGEIATANCPAFMALRTLAQAAFYQSGHIFSPERDGLTPDLPSLFRQHGLLDVQTRLCPLEYRAGTEEGEAFCEDMSLAFRTAEPFLRQWLRVPDDYRAMCQQAVSKMQQPGFTAASQLLTIWGTRGHMEE